MASPPGLSKTSVLGSGKNAPWLALELQKTDTERFALWKSHVRIALPQVSDISIHERDDDHHAYFRVRYNDRYDVPSPGLSDGTLRTGLHHMQLRNASMEVLKARYRRLRGSGLQPSRSLDHGPITSLYYRDPDGNTVEISASNFPTLAQAEAALASEKFQRNPGGEVIDPECWAA